MDEEVFDENTCPLLSIKKKDGKWDAYEIEANSSFLKNREPYLAWEPVPIDEDEMLLLKEIESSSIITQDDIFRLKSISDKTDELIYKLTHAGYFMHSYNGISKGAGFYFLQFNSGNYLLFPNKRKMQQWVKKS